VVLLLLLVVMVVVALRWRGGRDPNKMECTKKNCYK
jgi:hypothetical protein